MENPRKRTTVATAAGGDGLHLFDHQQQQMYDLNTTSAEGDKVVLVDRFGGTRRGELFGRPGTGASSGRIRGTRPSFAANKDA